MNWLGVEAEEVVVQYPTFAELRENIIPWMRKGYVPFGPAEVRPSEACGQLISVRLIRWTVPQEEKA